MLEEFQDRGLLKSRKQRTDSTHVVANIHDLNRLELAGRALQQALDAIAQVAPTWLAEWVAPDWFQRYSQPVSDYRLPQKQSEREALAVQIGADGLALLTTIYFNPDCPDALRQLDAIEILRQIWVQQYVLIEDMLRLRERKEMPPAAQLIQSPFDIEARFSRKRKKTWLGYKVHLTETCTDDAPHLITNVRMVNATQQDVDAVQPVHESLQERDLLPDTHFVDRGYTSAPLLFDSEILGLSYSDPLSSGSFGKPLPAMISQPLRLIGKREQ